jgi:hypothetical protein
MSSAATMAAAPEQFQVNLGPVARTNVTKLLAVGRGTMTASLDGNKLSLKGLFTGLASPATDAHLCSGVGIGTQGNCAGSPELTISKDANGTISADFTLTSKQVQQLHAGQLYVQINSQKAPAPAGTLWGWIMIAHETVGQDVPQEGHWFLPQYDMPQSVEHGSTHELKPVPNT